MIALNKGTLLVRPSEHVQDLINKSKFNAYGKDIPLTEFIIPEVQEEIVKSGLISKEQLDNTTINFVPEQQTELPSDTAAKVTIENGKTVITIVNGERALTDLTHEIVHISLVNNKLPAGYNTTEWDKIVDGLSNETKSKIIDAYNATPVSERRSDTLTTIEILY